MLPGKYHNLVQEIKRRVAAGTGAHLSTEKALEIAKRNRLIPGSLRESVATESDIAEGRVLVGRLCPTINVPNKE